MGPHLTRDVKSQQAGLSLRDRYRRAVAGGMPPSTLGVVAPPPSLAGSAGLVGLRTLGGVATCAGSWAAAAEEA